MGVELAYLELDGTHATTRQEGVPGTHGAERVLEVRLHKGLEQVTLHTPAHKEMNKSATCGRYQGAKVCGLLQCNRPCAAISIRRWVVP